MNEKLDFTQLRSRMETDRISRSKTSAIIDALYSEQENSRIQNIDRINNLYPISFGVLLIAASIYFYIRIGGLSTLRDAKGTGWNEYQFFIYDLIILCTGIFLILYGQLNKGMKNTK